MSSIGAGELCDEREEMSIGEWKSRQVVCEGDGEKEGDGGGLRFKGQRRVWAAAIVYGPNECFKIYFQWFDSIGPVQFLLQLHLTSRK